jgi:hypothetical protein
VEDVAKHNFAYNTAETMVRKDSEKDSERPHYYSQFWLDVAAGRRIIGAPKPNDETEQGEIEVPESLAPRRVGRIGGGHEESFMSPAATNGHSETIEHPIAEPIVDEEEIVEPETEDLLLDEEQEYQDDDLEDTDIPDMDLTPPEEEAEEVYDEDVDEEEEEEEDEDDLGWSGRGRKRNKPVRAPKQPPRKPPKREPRRGY